MDELIELIVRGILALISKSAQKKPPQSLPPTAPPTPGRSSASNAVPEWNTSQNPRARQAVVQHAREAAQRARQTAADRARHLAGQRDQAMRQHAWRKGMGAKPKAPVPPVPAPMPRAAPVIVRPAPPSAAPAISATAIRQLVRSRPTALRTIYALTEVIGQPLALRDSHPW